MQTTIDGLANITNSAKEIKTKDDQIVALTKAYKLIYKVSQTSEKEYDNNETISQAVEMLNNALEKASNFFGDILAIAVSKFSLKSSLIFSSA